jgi:methionyl-tRNA synthetase
MPVANSNRPFAVTTPLYYVNDVPHIGSAYTTIAVDAISRYQRLKGRPTLMITGTDEHGQKIQRTAEKAGRSPQVHCDQIVTGFTSLWDQLQIHYDRFSRTTDPRHRIVVTEFFKRVEAAGDIYIGHQTGFYCVACEEFKEERDLLENKHCPIHSNQAAEWRDEENYFFRLSAYQSKLEALYADRPDFIGPTSRRNEVLSFVAQGLQDFSISRVNLDWGIPIPGNDKHTLYVWFDALLGYVTALLDPDEDPSLDAAIAHHWPINLHVIGKDILRFHAVYWPAMLMSAGLPVSDRVYGHGFLTKDGQKMGKSMGNTLDPVALIETYGSDAVRYYFLKEIEFGRDGDFNETRFINCLNADLANDLGNLLNRTLSMAKRYTQQILPACRDRIGDDNPLAIQGQALGATVDSAYDRLAFSDVCGTCLALAQSGNKYLDQQAPWTKFKTGDQQAVEEILYAVLESVRLIAYLLAPIVPDLSNSIYQQLGLTADFNDRTIGERLDFASHASWGTLAGGQSLQDPSPIFRAIETSPTVP